MFVKAFFVGADVAGDLAVAGDLELEAAVYSLVGGTMGGAGASFFSEVVCRELRI